MQEERPARLRHGGCSCDRPRRLPDDALPVVVAARVLLRVTEQLDCTLPVWCER